MDAVAVLVAPRIGARAPWRLLERATEAAKRAGASDVLVILAEGQPVDRAPAGVIVALDGAGEPDDATAIQVAVDLATRLHAETIGVALSAAFSAEAIVSDATAWERLFEATPLPILVGMDRGRETGLVRIDAVAWPLLPLGGEVGRLWAQRPELVARRELVPTGVASGEPAPAETDVEFVTAALGRPPSAGFRVVVRDASGEPLVIKNAPFLDDGTPMPTTYWLVGKKAQILVGKLESGGGVRRAEEAVPATEIAAAHERYARERDAEIPPDHKGPRPAGGVGGTARGVKCLHAHLAWYLAGGADPIGRWVAQQLSGELTGPVAAVDCGTNSTRLLVLSAAGEILDREMIITRLGQGVDETGSLSDEAIDRTLAALARYRGVMDGFGVVRVRAAATSATRDADNRDAFFVPAAAVLGVRPELLDGTEEGRLAFRGATAGLDPAGGPDLVVDLGGGSTELVAGGADAADSPVLAESLDIGCVRVTERFLHHDPPTAGEIESARSFVRGVVEDAAAKHPALSETRRMIGVAGTISTLASLELGLDHYDSEKVHLARLSRTAVERWLGQLASEAADERRKRGAIEAGRADVIVGGAAVLAEVMAALAFDELIHSEHDILDGIAEELLAASAHKTP
jgi:exopolyphosphatase / guanosine-5'-triphosphate,3'-diphosphate pyrophosphatase